MGPGVLNGLQQAESRDRKHKSVDTGVRAHRRIINSLSQDSEIRMEKQRMLTCTWQWAREECVERWGWLSVKQMEMSKMTQRAVQPGWWEGGWRMEVEKHTPRRGGRVRGRKGREPREFSVRDTQGLRSGWASRERCLGGSRERSVTSLTPFTADDFSSLGSDDPLQLRDLPFADQPYRFWERTSHQYQTNSHLLLSRSLGSAVKCTL